MSGGERQRVEVLDECRGRLLTTRPRRCGTTVRQLRRNRPLAQRVHYGLYRELRLAAGYENTAVGRHLSKKCVGPGPMRITGIGPRLFPYYGDSLGSVAYREVHCR